MLFHLLLISFFSVTAAPHVYAQETAVQNTCSMEIKLLEKGTKIPLTDVDVYLLPDGVSEVTDSKARALFKNLPCQKHDWVVNLAGYKRLDFQETLDGNETATLYLQVQSESLYRTEVVAKREVRDGAQREVSQEEFITSIGSRGDPIIALENQPGFGTFSQQGGVILQGADPEDTRLYVNGHEVPLIFHSLGFSSIFIPDVIDSVGLYTAGFGSEYGRTTAGNINLTTRMPKTDRWHGMAYVDVLNSAAVIQGPLDKDKKHSFWFGGRVSYIGPIFNLVVSGDDNISFNQVPQFYDLEGSYAWEINDRWRFDLLGFGANDKVKLRIKDNEDPTFRGDLAFSTGFFRLIPRLKFDDGNKNQFEISIAQGIDRIDQRINEFYFDARLYAPTIRSEWVRQVNDRWTTIVGVDSKYTNFQADLRVPSGSFPNSEDDSVPQALRDIIDKRVVSKFWDLGVYARFNYNDESGQWLFSPNVRLDFSGLTDEFHISPRWEVTRKLTDIWSVRAATGIYYQTPQPPEVEETFGNPDLGDVRAFHYALSGLLDTRTVKNTNIWGDVTFFYKDLDNVVVDSEDTVVRNGQIEFERYNNDGQGQTFGSQVSLQFQKDKLSVGTSYTLLWSRRREPGISFYPTNFENRHNINLRGSYTLGKWVFSSRVRWITGSPLTPITGATYDLDNDIYVPFEGAVNSERLPYFFQWDVRIDRKWTFDRWIMSLYLDILNVTSRSNGVEYDYNFDYSSREFEGGIPILPSFGVKGEF